jgi:hypothetical protein
MSFEAVTMISMKITVWGLTPFRLVDIFQGFIRKICCLNIQVEEIYTLKMESADFYETFVNIYNTTRRYIPEDSKFQQNNISFNFTLNIDL